jgi:predicted dehydrogenase
LSGKPPVRELHVTSKIRLGVVGCGDVAFRTYLPALESLAEEAEVVATCDLALPRAETAAKVCARWSSSVGAYGDYSECLDHAGLEAVVNLTPGPQHATITRAALEREVHVFSEKPIANSVEDADSLMTAAQSRGRLLMCAPATMVTDRFRWLAEVAASNRYGPLTLITGRVTGMGPALWRDYAGNPEVFYGPEVGPLLDQGVYILHGATGLLGPARRIQAMGTIAIPRRSVMTKNIQQHTIEVRTNDHVLLQLEFDAGHVQLLASFATPAGEPPSMEAHFTGASVRLPADHWYEAEGPVDVWALDDEPSSDGWRRQDPPSSGAPVDTLIGMGPAHFVACLQGREEPVLTAAHARHVLEIALGAADAARSGATVELETVF